MTVDVKQYYQAPFTVSLAGEGGSICADKILRLLPGKRVVAKALWQEKEVVVKLFFHGRAKKHFDREIEGNKNLAMASVPAPKILYSGQLDNGQVYILIYEYLLDGQDLGELSRSAQSESLLHNAITLLSQMHVKGLRQKDLHLNNFFVSQALMYVLDAGSIKASKREVNIKTALKDLARIIALFAIKDLVVVRGLLNFYLKARTLSFKARFFSRLASLIGSVFRKEKQGYLSKIFRDCTKVKRIRTFSQLILCQRKFFDNPLQDYLLNIEEKLGKPTQVLKSGNTCTVFRCEVSGLDLVIKRYNIKGFWHGIKRLLQKSRAEKCWYNSHLLEVLDIATPQPIAMIEKRFGFF